MSSKPFCSVTGITNIINASVTENHGNSTSTVTIEALSTTLTLGDYITVTMGYSDGASGTVFRGYVKQIDKQSPSSTVSITANDIMIRAMDYFVAPANPDNIYKRTNVLAENLISDLLAMSGLTLTDKGSTYLTLAHTGELEVHLTSIYDYCKAVTDLITWGLWADRSGDIHFRNRKPFPMYGTSGQPNDVADSALTFQPTSANTLNLDYSENDKDLRNRIVVYGSGASAEASASSPYLPSGFYRSAVIGAELILDTQADCQTTADYNLALYNRLTKRASMSVIGNYTLEARKCITIDNSLFQNASYLQNGLWYIYGCEHSFSPSGYITSIDLRIE